MVATDPRETALLVTLGILGFVGVQAAGGPEVVGGLFLLAVGVVAPTLRGEQRRRDGA